MTIPELQFDTGSDSQFTYAGFWRRLVAYILDGIVLLLLFVAFDQFVGGIYECVEPTADGIGAELPAIMRCGTTGLGQALYVVVTLLYFAAMEASPRQATLGKMAMGIAVTDTAGGRITFGRAIGRNASKYVSLIILLIGFIMAAFTRRKQALHDIMANCLVVRRSA